MIQLSRPYVLDASNLHIGGGVQVGASVINEIHRMLGDGELRFSGNGALHCVASSEVMENVDAESTHPRFQTFQADSRPFRWAKFPLGRYDSILTIFGPAYRARRAPREIVGFALPRMIYDLELVGLEAPTLGERLANWIRWDRFGAADILVTETSDAAARIADRLPSASVSVVPNCVSSAVSDRSLWQAPKNLGSIEAAPGARVAVVARDYPHKNLDFLGRLGPELDRMGNRVTFIVTLEPNEWDRKSPQFKQYCMNLGILRQRELGPVYEMCDLALCPSLLEVSSATPLESLELGIPTLTADLPHFRSAFGDRVGYFDPFDAARAAQVVRVALLGSGRGTSQGVDTRMPSPDDRAAAYIAILIGDDHSTNSTPTPFS